MPSVWINFQHGEKGLLIQWFPTILSVMVAVVSVSQKKCRMKTSSLWKTKPNKMRFYRTHKMVFMEKKLGKGW